MRPDLEVIGGTGAAAVLLMTRREPLGVANAKFTLVGWIAANTSDQTMRKTITLIAATVFMLVANLSMAETPVDLPGDEFTAKDILDAQRWGFKLANDERYEEAAPYLQAAAKLGQKEAQARLGVMFLQGQGVPQNSLVGISWLGVAARGEEASDRIKKLFDRAWKQFPEEAAEQLTAYIDTFEAEYGESRIQCRMSRTAGSHISVEVCEFGDKWDTLQEMEQRLQNQATIGTRPGDGESTVEGFSGGL